MRRVNRLPYWDARRRQAVAPGPSPSTASRASTLPPIGNRRILVIRDDALGQRLLDALETLFRHQRMIQVELPQPRHSAQRVDARIGDVGRVQTKLHER